MQQCEAVQSQGAKYIPCRAIAIADSAWCTLHHQEQAKYYKLYKHASHAYKTYEILLGSSCVMSLPCIDLAIVVGGMSDLQALQDKAHDVRRKHTLASQVIARREDHHAQFCRGGDASHVAFLDGLKAERRHLTALLHILEEQAYSVLLTQNQAGWLQQAEVAISCEIPEDAPSDSESADSDSDHDSNSSRRSHTTPPSSQTSLDAFTSDRAALTVTQQLELGLRDHFCYEDVHRSRKAQLQTIILFKLEHDQDCSPTVAPARRLVLQAIFRKLIARKPTLMLAAQRFTEAFPESSDPIRDFVLWDELENDQLRALSKALSVAGSGGIHAKLLRDAIVDALSPSRQIAPQDPGEAVSLLGGFVWRYASKEMLSVEQAKHFYAFNRCETCLGKVCRSLLEVTSILAFADGFFPQWRRTSGMMGEAQLRRAGWCLPSYDEPDERPSTTDRVRLRTGKYVYSEREHRKWFHALVSADTPHALDMIASLAKSGEFEIVCEHPSVRSITLPTVNSLWMTRVRAGPSMRQRSFAKWTVEAKVGVKGMMHTLEEATTARFMRKFHDAYSLLVLDNRPGRSYEDFAKAMAEAMTPWLPPFCLDMPPLHGYATDIAHAMFRKAG
ncbi:uncharacterized protein L969DRAFT_61887 [Mixia osmundae IAM 14324]|uniref:Uncharacterized protein n=1 Tax=Mixia osmundae (strain CBS 9802 / IAM 14324 / JCM 22182 / KY 12970) TaxID=764103 RepID=G7E3C6_MIXOS|nr:uncharacterized protein L969DRAFT_61887 [Mixia osmundae IAM 14324]KEI39322.1 hypothetical protein L969DRAFT_61887 [Mixia osmundae IAM 14324]GAA97336.1 hypothetical protein E5Q_04014 [Mixia osmundae IAM 14324]